MLDTWRCFNDQPIVINDRQAAPAVQWRRSTQLHSGVRTRSAVPAAVDTHGCHQRSHGDRRCWASTCVFACASCRSARCSYGSEGDAPPGNHWSGWSGKVSLRKIRAGWMELAAPDRLPSARAASRPQKLSPPAWQRRLGILWHAGRRRAGKSFLRTVFCATYFTIPEFRREMHAPLNRGESIHHLQRAVPRACGRLAAAAPMNIAHHLDVPHPADQRL